MHDPWPSLAGGSIHTRELNDSNTEKRRVASKGPRYTNRAMYLELDEESAEVTSKR